MLQYLMAVAERTKGGKNKELGKVTIMLPELGDFGIAAERVLDDAGQPVSIDGLPAYKDGTQQFLYAAVIAYCKAITRNRLDGISVKAGMSLPATLADYVAAATSGKGHGLGAYRATLDGLEQYLTKQKSAKYAQAVTAVLRQRAVLATLPLEKKAKVLAAIRGYAESLDEATLAAQASTLQTFEQACSTPTDADLDF